MSPEAFEILRTAVATTSQRRVAELLGYRRHTVISLVLAGKYMSKTDRLEARVLERLAPVPDWLQVLRREVQEHTQAVTASRLRLAESTVSQVLSGKYKAATTRIERRVRGCFMGAKVVCPILGELPTDACQDLQERPEPTLGNWVTHTTWLTCRGREKHHTTPCQHFNCGGRPGGAAAVPSATPATTPSTKEQP